MKVLVTGAHGKVGRALVPRLMEVGHELRACDLTRPVARPKLVAGLHEPRHESATDLAVRAGDEDLHASRADTRVITKRIILRLSHAARDRAVQPAIYAPAMSRWRS